MLYIAWPLKVKEVLGNDTLLALQKSYHAIYDWDKRLPRVLSSCTGIFLVPLFLFIPLSKACPTSNHLALITVTTQRSFRSTLVYIVYTVPAGTQQISPTVQLISRVCTVLPPICLAMRDIPLHIFQHYSCATPFFCFLCPLRLLSQMTDYFKIALSHFSSITYSENTEMSFYYHWIYC